METFTLVLPNVNAEHVQAITNYLQLLEVANQTTNLIRYGSQAELVSRHVENSLLLREPLLAHAPAGHWIDIGTGGGFPAVILAITCPETQWVWVEATGKKAMFLQGVVDTLQLNNRVTVLHGRAELLAHQGEYRGQFCGATSRAVASTPVISELCAGFVKLHGCVLLLKGQNFHQELGENPNTWSVPLGLAPYQATSTADGGYWVQAFKTAPTQKRYPRAWAELSKK